MEYIVTSEEMKKIDQYTIENVGISAMVLVENAARNVADYIVKKYPEYLKILVYFGNGNNGADAICLARILSNLKNSSGMKQYDVSLVEASKEGKRSKECNQELSIAKKFHVPILDRYHVNDYDLLIEGIFGVGLNREITDPYLSYIKEINNSQVKEIISLDIPSGIHGTNGLVMGTAVKANTTITFQHKKTGHLLGEGPEYTGNLICKDIGLYQGNETKEIYSIFSHNVNYRPTFMNRKVTGNKGTFGKVLLLAGGQEYPGAAILTTLAAYRSGAGMVRVITHKNNKSDILNACPGAMLLTYAENYVEQEIIEALNWCDVIAIGPGMGSDDITLDILKVLLRNMNIHKDKPLVIDADAINFISENREYLKYIKELKSVVFAPHMKELSRLLNKTILEIRENLIDITRAFSGEWGCTLVCKDAKTLVLDEKKSNTFINQTGNDGMATAGSGDVLTGMIASICCLEKNSFEAASFGVHMHGMAGDMAYKKYKRGLIASDIVEAINEVM